MTVRGAPRGCASAGAATARTTHAARTSLENRMRALYMLSGAYSRRPPAREAGREQPGHRALHAGAEAIVATQEGEAFGREPHASRGTRPARPFDQLEAGRALELAQVAPRAAIRH